jgi:hypothetical protein
MRLFKGLYISGYNLLRIWPVITFVLCCILDCRDSLFVYVQIESAWKCMVGESTFYARFECS